MNVVVLVKGAERYVFLFGDSEVDRHVTICTAGRMAADPQLSFDWYSAAVVASKIRIRSAAEQATMN